MAESRKINSVLKDIYRDCFLKSKVFRNLFIILIVLWIYKIIPFLSINIDLGFYESDYYQVLFFLDLFTQLLIIYSLLAISHVFIKIIMVKGTSNLLKSKLNKCNKLIMAIFLLSNYLFILEPGDNRYIHFLKRLPINYSSILITAIIAFYVFFFLLEVNYMKKILKNKEKEYYEE